jgi:hypothetical protein
MNRLFYSCLSAVVMTLAGHQACRASLFTSDTEFYRSLGEPVFTTDTRLNGSPDLPGQDQIFQRTDLSVRVGAGQIVVNGHRARTTSLPRLDGLEFARLQMLYSPSAEVFWDARLKLVCVEWPLGHSGSASRWRGVAVLPVERPRSAMAFAGPYAGCGSIVRVGSAAGRRSLAWGVFDISFESAHEARGGFFVLRQLSIRGLPLTRFMLRYPDPANMLRFDAAAF